MKHLNFYNNENFANQYRGLAFPYLGYTEDDITTPEYEGKTYISTILDSYVSEYFTITALHDGTAFTVNHSKDIVYEYSTDKVTWHELHTSNGDVFSGQINTGEKFYIKANIPANSLPKYSETYENNGSKPGGIGQISCSVLNEACTFNVSGNIMSLLYGDDFIGKQLTNEYEAAFCSLFSGSLIVDASMLVLSRTTSVGCYSDMFFWCASLVNAPELPATTLASNCYHNMFHACTSLTSAPELPATTLALRCYSTMFVGCTSLTSAPELPATTLAEECYYGMFGANISLTTAPKLPATTLTKGCYDSMFAECTSLTTAPELPITTLANGCYTYMFSDCTSLITAPELPATTLEQECYYGMFSGCTSLNEITMLATDISAPDCLSNWVSNVAPTGTFYKHADMNDLEIDSNNGIPIGWTLQDWATNPYEREYLTITAVNETEYIQVNQDLDYDYPPLYYSYDKENWGILKTPAPTAAINTTLDTTYEITLNAGQSVYLKCYVEPNTLPEPEIDYDDYMYSVLGTCGIGRMSLYSQSGAPNVKLSGNIMSLLYGDDFIGKKDLSAYPGAFYCLFDNDESIMDISNLVLPATTLSSCCYRDMFSGCTSLTGSTPELPAISLASFCYAQMYFDTNITELKLSAIHIPEDCEEPFFEWNAYIYTGYDNYCVLYANKDEQGRYIWEIYESYPNEFYPTLIIPCDWYVDGVQYHCAG